MSESRARLLSVKVRQRLGRSASTALNRIPWASDRRILRTLPEAGAATRIAVLSDGGLPELLADIERTWPDAKLTVVGPGSDVHVVLAANGRFDVVIDAWPVDGNRVQRFQSAFYHLRQEGSYIVVGGAAEASNASPGSLGAFLAEGGPVIGEVFAQREDLVVTSRASRVLAELDEPRTAAYLAARPELGRVLKTIEAVPVPPPRFSEGPIVREPRTDRPMRPSPITLREFYDVYVAPHQVVGTDRVLYADTFRRSPHLTQRHVRPVAPRFGTPRADWSRSARELPGTYLHLDNEFRGHFGHVLTETAGRAWTWPEARELDPSVRALVGATRKRPTITEWEAEIYEAFGIPRDRLTVIDGPVKVERLISGTSLFSNLDYVHPLITQAWDLAGDRLAAAASTIERPRRIFVSRREDKRSCRNSAAVEKYFGTYGFTTVYPEDWPIGEQVALFRGADVIAGFAGSGMFQIALVKQPKHVLSLSHSRYRARNEYFMAAARGHRLDAIISKPDDPADFQSSFTFDFADEGERLRELLEALA